MCILHFLSCYNSEMLQGIEFLSQRRSLFHIVIAMAADDLAMEGTKVSALVVLT